MKDQKSRSSDELQEAFAKARADARESLEKNGAGEILRHMSNVVSRLQQAGADISIEVRDGSSNNAYDMVYTAASAANYKKPAPANEHVTYGTVDVYGFIRAGESVRLFAIASRVRDEEVSQLFLSNYSVSDEGGRIKISKVDTRTQAVIPAEIFDFANDGEALMKFEAQLASLGAGNEVLLENDPGSVFNKPATSITKPRRFKPA